MILCGCANQRSNIRSNNDSPSLSVILFHNDTFQPGLEEKLTNLTIEEFLADGRAVVENDSDAEILLEGRIKKYTRSILSLDGNDDVNLYQLAISVDIPILNSHSKETIGFLSNVNITTTYVPKRNDIEFETETEAQNRLLEDLAEEIVYQLLDRNKKILTKNNINSLK